MTMTQPRTIDELGALADGRTSELAARRRIPADLYGAAASAGLFRQLVPIAQGGGGRSPLEWFDTGLDLARAEPSLAWVVTQGAVELGWIAAGGDPAWAAEVLGDPLAASASSTAGRGRLTVSDGRAQLEGRWTFNTGCQGATWIGGLAVVDGPTDADGRPVLRWGWVPADRAQVVEDWDGTGMRGTGSHTTVIERQEVPLAWTFDPQAPTDNDRGAHRCLVGNGNWPIAAAVAATQLGNARRALDAVHELVLTKRPPPDFVPLSGNAAVQRRLVEAEGLWAAGRATVARELEAMWDEALVMEELSSDTRVRLHRACMTANLVAVGAVDAACDASGTSGFRSGHVLDRCWRDAHTLEHHIAVNGAAAEHNAAVGFGLVASHVLV